MALTYLVTVRERHEQGGSQEFEARTISINRHGLHLEVSQPLAAGQLLRLVNPLSHEEANFRVAGPVTVPVNGGGVFSLLGPLARETPERREFGAESVDTQANFWGVFFPPLPSNVAADWTVTLECRSCGRVQALALSMAEADALEGSAGVSWPCDACHTVTLWGYPGKERQVAPHPTGDGAVAAAGEAGGQERRGSLHLPVLIRRSNDEVEQTESVDSSKSGFSFSSAKDYEIGEDVSVACPYAPGAPTSEVRAQIARRQDVRGSNCRIFGVRYASPEIPQGRLASIET